MSLIVVLRPWCRLVADAVHRVDVSSIFHSGDQQNFGRVSRTASLVSNPRPRRTRRQRRDPIRGLTVFTSDLYFSSTAIVRTMNVAVYPDLAACSLCSPCQSSQTSNDTEQVDVDAE